MLSSLRSESPTRGAISCASVSKRVDNVVIGSKPAGGLEKIYLRVVHGVVSLSLIDIIQSNTLKIFVNNIT